MKKIIALLLSLVCALSLCACGGSKTEPAAPAAETPAATEASAEETEAPAEEAAPADGALTVTEGKLVMGTNAAFPPYEYYEGDNICGIDAEVAGLIAEKLGVELEIVDMDFGSIIASVQTGKVDIGVAGMTVTEERLKNVNFTDSYSQGVQVIIVPEGSDITDVDGLEGALIGTQEATTGYIYCSEDYGEDNVVSYPNGATAVESLLNGKVDCVVIDKQPALNFVEVNEGLKILDTEYVVEDYAIAVNKDNTALLEKINAALAELQAEGKIQEVLDKYIK